MFRKLRRRLGRRGRHVAICEASPVGLALMDRDWRLEYANPQARCLLGLEGAGHRPGDRWLDAIHPRERAETLAA
jgi:PAS domain-containing protein